MTDKLTVVDAHERLQKISNLVCQARNLAEELESDASDPREWHIDEDWLENFHLLVTNWRDELETIEGDIDDFIPQKSDEPKTVQVTDWRDGTTKTVYVD